MISMKSALFFVFVALFIAGISGGIALLVSKSGAGPPGVETLLPTATPTPELKVYISGAVTSPGVYTMNEGDRVEDVIAAAGGGAKDAQLSCINQALRVTDEAHYHVPGPEEPCQAASTTTSTTGEDLGIDLNTASVAQLESLPGVGEVKAHAIIDYRTKNGPFQSIVEVMEVPGIGPVIYENISDLVYVGTASP